MVTVSPRHTVPLLHNRQTGSAKQPRRGKKRRQQADAQRNETEHRSVIPFTCSLNRSFGSPVVHRQAAGVSFFRDFPPAESLLTFFRQLRELCRQCPLQVICRVTDQLPCPPRDGRFMFRSGPCPADRRFCGRNLFTHEMWCSLRSGWLASQVSGMYRRPDFTSQTPSEQQLTTRRICRSNPAGPGCLRPWHRPLSEILLRKSFRPAA